MKVCTKCGLEKTLDSFSKHKGYKDGLQYMCKVCVNAYSKAHYQENKENGLARARAYNQANPERVAATNKAWHQANPEEVKAYQKAWRDANPEKAAAKNKAWRKANLDKVREYCRKRRAMKVNLNENYTKEDEAYTMDLFDNMCYNCDSTDNLHIDHHKPLSRGNPLTRDNAVVLCGSCNSSKGTKSPSEFYSLGDLNLLSAILR